MLEKLLKEVMWAERMSQAYLGLILGVNQQSVSSMLARDMKVSNFLKICDALGYEVVMRKGEREFAVK